MLKAGLFRLYFMLYPASSRLSYHELATLLQGYLLVPLLSPAHLIHVTSRLLLLFPGEQ